MYRIFIGDKLLKECRDKGEVNGTLNYLSKNYDQVGYSIVQDVTNDFPSLEEHRIADRRLEQINKLGDTIDFSFEKQYDHANSLKRERWDRLMKEQNEWEYKCGY